MKNQILTLCFCLFITLTAKSQQDLTLFNFNDIPQSSYSNPANQFNGKFFLGLPGISSTYYSLSNSGFAYSDFIKKDGDSLRTDFNSMIAELEEENFLSFNTKIDLLSFGFKLGKRTQLLFNVTENVNLRFNYSRDFINFIHKGNLAFDDNTVNFDGTGFAANYYREFGLAISHQFGDKLRLGARFKYLYGIANLDTERSDLRLKTNEDTYALTANADVLINSSAPSDFNVDSLMENEGFIWGNDNQGFGLDFGMNYELSNRLSLNASVIDLGYIEWGENVKNYAIDDGEYFFEGIEIDAFSPQDDTSGSSPFDRISDSLESAFNVSETTEGYTTALTGRFYAGANYKLTEKLVVGGLFQGEFFKRSLRPSFTASANYKLTKWIGLAASYSMINRSFNNLGVGLNINPGPVQIYVVSDNVMSAFQPQHARHAQVRAGINLIFGSEKVREINPSFSGVTSVKKEKREKKERKGREKEVKEIIQPEPETIAPVEKTDSLINQKTDSVQQKVDSSKTESAKTIIEAVEENNEKMKRQSDSIKQGGTEQKKNSEKEIEEPMIHPTPEKVKTDSTQKEIKKVEQKVMETKTKADSTLKKQVIPVQEKAKEMKAKSDSIPAPVNPAPKKEEPVDRFFFIFAK